MSYKKYLTTLRISLKLISSPALLRSNGQKLYIFRCTTWWLDIHIHWNAYHTKPINVSITSHLNHLDFFLSFMLRTPKLYSLSKWKGHSTELSTVATLPYSSSAGHIHLANLKLKVIVNNTILAKVHGKLSKNNEVILL